MAKDLYVRVRPKAPVTTFNRCGFSFTLLWTPLTDLDDATVERLEGEQMLETSTEKPKGFDDQEAEQAAAEAEEPVTEYDGLKGSTSLPSTVKFESGLEINLDELVKLAFAASHLSADGWNGLPQADRDQLLDSHAELLRDKKTETENQSQAAQTEAGEIAVLKSQVSSLTSERDTARSTLSTVTSERDGLKTTVSTLETKVTTLEADLQAAKAAKPAPKTPASKAK